MATPQTFQSIIGVAKETTFGTPVAITDWFAIENPRINPQALRHIVDNGLRGVPSVDFDLIPGPGESTLQWSGNVYMDQLPLLILALFGPDAFTGSVDPWSHTFAVNAAPNSLTVEWQNGVQTYQMTGTRISNLTVNFNPRDGAATYSVQATGKLGTKVSNSTVTVPLTTAVAGWQGTVSVAAASPATLMEGSLVFQRALKPQHGLANTQDVVAIFPQGLQITARLTFQFDLTTGNPVEYEYYATSTPAKNAVVLKLIQAATPERSFQLTCTKAGWRVADIEPNDNIYTVVAQLNGLHNTTDAGPGKVLFKNAKNGAY